MKVLVLYFSEVKAFDKIILKKLKGNATIKKMIILIRIKNKIE